MITLSFFSEHHKCKSSRNEELKDHDDVNFILMILIFFMYLKIVHLKKDY